MSLLARARARGGFSIILLSLGITMLFTFAALTVDVGYLYYQKSRLQMITDVAALSALGTCSTNQSVAAQQNAINASVTTIMAANYGSAADRPTFTTTFTTTQTNTNNPVEVNTVTLDCTQGVSTTFWRVMNVLNVNIQARARVERIYLTQRATLADGTCVGFFAAGTFTVTGNAGRFDSYDSTIGDYNPVNAPVPASPNAGGTFDRGNMNVMANGAFTFANSAYNYFGNLRSVGNMTIRATPYVRGSTITRGSLNPAPNNPRVTGTESQNDVTVTALPNMATPELPSTSVSDYDNTQITSGGAITGAELTNARNGDLNSSRNGQFFLPAGRRYLFTRFRATSNTTRIVITGSTGSTLPTRIWFRGTVNNAMVVQGGLSQSTAGENANELVILGTNTAGSITLTCRTFNAGSPPATPETFAQIYAPDLSVTIAMDSTAGTQFLGSVVANNIALDTPATAAAARSQSWVYDESLGCTLQVDPTGVRSGTPEGMSSRVHLIE